MSVKKTARGGWQARWRDETGRQRARTFRTRDAAYSHLHQQLAERHRLERYEIQDSLLRERSMRDLALMHAAALDDSIDPHGHYVYCLWGDDTEKPLYVGRSSNVLGRIGTHFTEREKRTLLRRVTLTRCDDFDAMCELERRLIAALRPPLNIAGVA